MSIKYDAQNVWDRMKAFSDTCPAVGEKINLDCGCSARSVKPKRKGTITEVTFNYCEFHAESIDQPWFYRRNRIKDPFGRYVL